MAAKSTRGAAQRSNRQTAGKLRIIGGEWRGRRFPVAELPGLRPTTDRIRETLFNWLAPELADRHCLDLFAGTGALGLEALSRGAASCDFIELQRTAVVALEQTLVTLEALQRATVVHADALSYLQRYPGDSDGRLETPPPYDLVFLDPPFDKGLLEPALKHLERGNLLSANAILYVETAATGQVPALPEWDAFRSKQSGGVSYALYRRRETGQ